MAHYTTEVRTICESLYDAQEPAGGDSAFVICSSVYDKVFWNSLRLFDSAYSAVLFPKILLHYYTREIAFETAGLWKLKLNTRMNDILPFYNKMYESELLKFNPLHNTDLSRTHVLQHEGKNVNTDVRQSAEDGRSYNVYSDTPQGSLIGVESEVFLTDARKITSGNQGTSVGNYDEDTAFNDVYQELLQGNSGSANYSKLLKDFRDTFLNIDLMVINELKDLFFKLW